MIVQFNTDKNIQGKENLEKFVSEKSKRVLKHYTNKITRIEVFLSDQNADKGGADDIQCKIEARIEGVQPVLVASRSATKEEALEEALNKMKATLASVIGKMKRK